MRSLRGNGGRGSSVGRATCKGLTGCRHELLVLSGWRVARDDRGECIPRALFAR
jgi:hypothetical protein